MQRKPQKDLIDPSDFCRECRGRGTVKARDYNSRGELRDTIENCYLCSGSGSRTVKVIS